MGGHLREQAETVSEVRGLDGASVRPSLPPPFLADPLSPSTSHQGAQRSFILWSTTGMNSMLLPLVKILKLILNGRVAG